MFVQFTFSYHMVHAYVIVHSSTLHYKGLNSEVTAVSLASVHVYTFTEKH